MGPHWQVQGTRAKLRRDRLAGQIGPVDRFDRRTPWAL